MGMCRFAEHGLAGGAGRPELAGAGGGGDGGWGVFPPGRGGAECLFQVLETRQSLT